MSADTTLTCRDCGQSFTFTSGEQDFYASRGFSEPSRCADCRAARKSQRDTGGSSYGSYGGSSYSGGGGYSPGGAPGAPGRLRGALSRLRPGATVAFPPPGRQAVVRA